MASKTKKHKRNVNMLDAQESSSDDACVYKLSLCTVVVNKHDAHPHFLVCINGQQVNVTGDPGAEFDVMDERDYSKMRPRPKLSQDNTKIFPYGSATVLHVKGVFSAEVNFAMQKSDELFYIVAGSGGSLLGWNISKRLQLVRVVQQVTTDKLQTTPVDRSVSCDDLFLGLGQLNKFKGKLHINEMIQTIAQPHRRMPFHVRKKFEQELKRDEELGVIERVEGATPSVPPLFEVSKCRRSNLHTSQIRLS